MPHNRVLSNSDEAVADIPDGAVIMVGGFGAPGTPQDLVSALLRKGVTGLTCISGPWYGRDPDLYDVARLVASGRVKRVTMAPPISAYAEHDAAPQPWRDGRLEVEIVPHGTLAERIRAGGAGLGGVLLPIARGAALHDRKERRVVEGEECTVETPLKADFALLRAHRADTLGNLVYRHSQRNWNPIMAMAADVTIAEVDEIVQPGELDPELVVTPGIYVERTVKAAAHEAKA